jgi:dTDP-4-amino-4,6-dideoxygalactose transaminase
MNDIQAALGLSQMKRLDQYIKRRHEIAKYYDNALKNLPLVTPWQSSNNYSSYHLYTILIEENLAQKTQRQVYDELKKNDIGINLHYIPVHRQPYYENLGFKKNDFPQAENFHRKVLSIPMYASLQDEQQKYVIEIIKKILIK